MEGVKESLEVDLLNDFSENNLDISIIKKFLSSIDKETASDIVQSEFEDNGIGYLCFV